MMNQNKNHNKTFAYWTTYTISGSVQSVKLSEIRKAFTDKKGNIDKS